MNMSSLVCVLLISIQLWTADGKQNHKRHAEPIDPIIFPGPIKNHGGTMNRFGGVEDIRVPEQCRHKTFCHLKPPNYPQDMFDEIFKGKKIPSQPELIIPDVGNRHGDENEDGCQSEVTYEPVYMVKYNDEEWRLVVQAPKYNYIQQVRLETCLNENASCYNVFPKVPDYTTFCKQKYGVWELLVAAKNTTQKIKANLPICCSCFYKQTELQ